MCVSVESVWREQQDLNTESFQIIWLVQSKSKYIIAIDGNPEAPPCTIVQTIG